MYRATLNIGRRGVVLHAISAVDIALWDLFGKQLGVPVYELLGGKLRPSLPAYASWLYATEDLDALAAEAAAWAAQGFTRSSSGFPTGRSRGRRGSRTERRARADGGRRGRARRRRDGRRVHELGRRLRGSLHPRNRGRRHPPALARGAARSPTTSRASRGSAPPSRHPIAAGEHEATRYGFRDLVTAGAVDVLQPDVNRLGGITEARRVWALGETFGLDVVPHLGFAHNAHLEQLN